MYHRLFGYKTPWLTSVGNVDTMSRMNYLEFSGAWTLPNVPTEQMKVLRDLFNNGVKFWHNPEGTSNPFQVSVADNIPVA